MASLKTITGTFTGPDGNGIACQVKAVLSQACTVPGTQEVIQNAARVFSNPSGVFSLSLYANNDLTPTSTSYTVTAVGNVDGASVVGTWTIVVPQSPGPFEISNLLAVPPPVPSPPGALDSQVVHLALTETITGVKSFSANPTFNTAGINPLALSHTFAGVNVLNLVTDCGADPSGTADSTAAIVTWLNSGYLLYAPPGTYKYSSVAAAISSFTIWAYGATFLSTLGKTANTVAFDLTTPNQANAQIIGGTWDFQTAVDVDVDAVNRAVSADTIRLGGTTGNYGTDILVRDVRVKNSRNTPIHIQKAQKVDILNTRSFQSLGNGIFCSDISFDLNIDGVIVLRSGDDSIAVVSDADLAALCQRVSVTRFKCFQTYGQGVDFSGVDGGTISDGQIDTTWGPGIVIWQQGVLGTCKNIVVSNDNVIRNPGQYFGIGQFKTTIHSTPHGVYVTGAVDQINIAYPRVINPGGGDVVFGTLTGTPTIRRGSPPPQDNQPGAAIRTPATAIGTGQIVADRMYAVPVVVEHLAAAQTINIKVTTQGSATPNALCRLGIYNDNGKFSPGALVLDAGTVDCTTIGLKTIAINQSLTPGIWWLVCVGQAEPTTQPILNVLTGQAPIVRSGQDPSSQFNGYTNSGIAGALPASFSIQGLQGNCPSISLTF